MGFNSGFKGLKKLLNTKHVFWFSLQPLSETFLILRRSKRDMNKNNYWSWREIPVFLSDSNETWIFFDIILKNTQLSDFMQILLVEAQSFQEGKRTEGRTDRHDEINSCIWVPSSRCADQSLANTVYTNTTEKLYTFYFLRYTACYGHTYSYWLSSGGIQVQKKIAAEDRL